MYRTSHLFTGITVDSGRNIYSNHRNPGLIDLFYDFSISSGNFSCQSHTENRIHDNSIFMVYGIRDKIYPIISGNCRLGFHSFAIFFRIAHLPDIHVISLEMKNPRSSHTIPAVISASAYDQNTLCGIPTSQNLFRYSKRRPLHQYQRRYSHLFDRKSIQLLHLLTCHYFFHSDSFPIIKDLGDCETLPE